MEIDIYLPQLNLGFEFNGVWWHSDEYKRKSSHLDKTNFFTKREIKLKRNPISKDMGLW
jgi:hypothetical protein